MTKRTWKLRSVVALGIGLALATTSAVDAAHHEGACETGRVRKDVKNLTSAEKAKIVSAIHTLKATPSPFDARYTYYDQFVRWHQMAVVVSTQHDQVGIAHHNPAFPPWHRKMLWLYEDGLCRVSGDPKLALPYWDWTDPESTAATFALDFLGPGGKAEDGYAVTEGPFNRDTWQLNILPYDPATRAMTQEKYLIRAIGIDTGSPYPILLPTIVDVNDTLAEPIYDTKPWGLNSNHSFRNTLEGFVIDPATGKVDLGKQTMHNIVHDWVGGIFRLSTAPDQFRIGQGTMEPLDVSPNDPAFFIHHANVDRVWASWQQRYPGPENYLPRDGEGVCPYSVDDVGPTEKFAHVSDFEHNLMMALSKIEIAFPGMRLDDWMYPYCLDRYKGTLAHVHPTPKSQIDSEALGYVYEDYYAVPEPKPKDAKAEKK